MNKIQDEFQFGKIVNDFTKNNQGLFTNCFLTPNNVRKYTNQKHMYFSLIEEGVLFLCEEKDFCYLYFFAQNNNFKIEKQLLSSFNKPIALDWISIEGHNEDRDCKVKENFIKNNFKYYKTYRRMFFFDNQNPSIEKHITSLEFCNGFPSVSNSNEIIKVWRDNLDIYSSPIPTEEEVCELIHHNQIICSFNNVGMICAALQIGFYGNMGCVERIAVSRKFRRNGLANTLLNYVYREYSEIHKYYLWVDCKNHPAILLYENIGFNFDNKKNDKYILAINNQGE